MAIMKSYFFPAFFILQSNGHFQRAIFSCWFLSSIPPVILKRVIFLLKYSWNLQSSSNFTDIFSCWNTYQHFLLQCANPPVILKCQFFPSYVLSFNAPMLQSLQKGLFLTAEILIKSFSSNASMPVILKGLFFLLISYPPILQCSSHFEKGYF